MAQKLPQPAKRAVPVPHDLRIPTSDNPVVSIIVPTYGQPEATLICLKSIVEHAPRVPIEVIVVDDCYPNQEAVNPLREVQGVRLIRNLMNIGFLMTCNH